MSTAANSFNLLLLLLLLCLLSCPCPLLSIFIVPPPGNSIAIRAIALDGKLACRCNKATSQWVPLQKTATLRDSIDTSKIIGYYTSMSKPNRTSINAGKWSLINNEGDRAESGHAVSIVAGKEVSVSDIGKENMLPDFLACATLHEYDGMASRVSYIAQGNATSSLLQIPSHCDTHDSILSVPFKAEYVFWTQDLLPPQVPVPLAVPSKNRPVQAFFGHGVIKYTYDRNLQAWRKRQVAARLHDVPGGIRVGGFSLNVSIQEPNQSNELACVIVDDPNGFRVCGKQIAASTSVDDQSSVSWCLYAITSNHGYIASALGPFTFAQMLSTWGGLPPANDTTISKAWRSPFTAIFWLYTDRGV